MQDDREHLIMYARCTTDWRRQMRDAMSLLPALIGAVIIGFGVVITSLWSANWSPPAFSFVVATIFFAFSPMFAMSWWMRRQSRITRADTKVIIHPEAFEIIPLDEELPVRRIEWRHIFKVRIRAITALSVAVRITTVLGSNPRGQVEEFWLCAAARDARKFATEVKKRSRARR